MQAVPAEWSTSALTHFLPGEERRGAHQYPSKPSVVSGLHGEGSRLLNLPHPAGGSAERTSLNLLQVKLCFTLPNSPRSLLFSSKRESKETEQTTHPLTIRGDFSGLRASWGQTWLARLTSLPLGETAILARNLCRQWLFSPAVPSPCAPCCSSVCHRPLSSGTQAAGLQGSKTPGRIPVVSRTCLFASTFLEDI